MKNVHGEKGHLNIYVKDHDSVVTDFGKHDRIVCFQPQFDDAFNCVVMYCRCDHKWNLGEPTTEQILQVARKDQGIKGKFKMTFTESSIDGMTTDYYFKKL